MQREKGNVARVWVNWPYAFSEQYGAENIQETI